MVETTKRVTGSFRSVAKRAPSESIGLQWVAKDRLPIANFTADVLCKQVEGDECELVPLSLAGALFVSLLAVGA
jgi:hypothetical protein